MYHKNPWVFILCSWLSERLLGGQGQGGMRGPPEGAAAMHPLSLQGHSQWNQANHTKNVPLKCVHLSGLGQIWFC